jgi:hypothetical protein
VAIADISPALGSAVPVRDCPPGVNGTHTILCTDDLRATFAVINEGQERVARLRVVFADGARQCGSAWLPRVSFVTATPIRVSTSTVYLSWETSEGAGTPVSLVQPCELPVTTRRIVVEMWEEGHPSSPVAVQEFGGSYSFVR